MRREDIDRIALEYFNDKESEHEMDEVFDLAKKALEERKEDVPEREQFKGDAISEIEKLPSVTPQPKTGHISIDAVMSVFDDFMCGEVDGDGIEIFREMLIDKAGSEDK